MVDPVAPVTSSPAAQTSNSGKPTPAQIEAFGRALYNATAANPPLSNGGGDDDDDDGSTLKLGTPPMPILTSPDAPAPATGATGTASTTVGSTTTSGTTGS